MFDEDRNRKGLTGFGLAVDCRGLYTTHFDKLLQKLLSIKQEIKEWAASRTGQTMKWISVGRGEGSAVGGGGGGLSVVEKGERPFDV